MAAFYGVYHGPEGLKKIAGRIHSMTAFSAKLLASKGYTIVNGNGYFDTLHVQLMSGQTSQSVHDQAAALGVNIRIISETEVGIAFGESITLEDTIHLLTAFGITEATVKKALESDVASGIPAALQRSSKFMTHANFNTHHSETQMLRYMKSLEAKDLSLNYSMISLGKLVTLLFVVESSRLFLFRIISSNT